MILQDTWVRASTVLKRWSSHATEPQILYPAIAIVALALIWGATWNRIDAEFATARKATAASSHELADTYEAQVVRALREIDQTLKLVRYAYTGRDGQALLQELKFRALLPPDLIFTVRIADYEGNVVASTHSSALASVAGEDYFEQQRHSDAISVGRAFRRPGSPAWRLQFSRALKAPDGLFAGAVMISVDAAYFVSSYDASKIGNHALLGLLGIDGQFRARRTGETVSAGEYADYTAFFPASGEIESPATVLSGALDGVIRYTSARKLYEFPLALIVGLSAEDGLRAARGNMRTHVLRAAGASILLLLIVTALGRLSMQLRSSRLRAVEEHMARTAQAEYIAYHDGLTKLPNRSLFSKLLIQSIGQASRYKRHLAVLFLDLDRFKHINDTLGHEAGDQLLREVAARLTDCLRGSDTVARIGGDEFVVMLPELNEQKYAANVAGKILAAISRPFVLAGQDCRISASIGISTYPQDGLDEETLTKNADTAMYRAKEEGRNSFRFFSDATNADSL